MKKNYWLMLLFAALLILVAACGKDTNDLEKETENNNNAEAEEMEEDAGSADKDVFTVATDNSYAPFEFIDDETGELEGFDVELIEALAEEADIEIEIQQLEFDGIVAGVGSGKFDIGIAGMTITDERKENIDFSQPYYEAGLILAVTDDNDDIESIDDVDDKVVATRVGSTSEDYLKDETDAEVESFPEIVEAYQVVMQGKVDAVLYDLPNVLYYANKETGGELDTVGDRLTGEDYGIAFPKGSEIRDDIDDALTTLKEDGTYDEIYEKWFGESPDESEE
ncbi:MAG TPA: transporter substrate-binding domain-containing protein [Pseudogracilibacillus sp.]|nr:transporter substrate-binding domain-containing protein [Pseudogracilibacillus sp.]